MAEASNNLPVIPEAILNRPFKQVSLTNTLIRELLPKLDQYQRRLLFLLVRDSWQISKGQRLDDSFNIGEWGNHKFTFKTKELLFDEDSDSISYALTCCSKLMDVKVPFKFGTKRKIIGEVNFLSGWIHEIGSGEVTVSLNDITWQAMYNFASHYQNADIYICLSLKKYASFVLYTYIYDQDTFEISLDLLRERLDIVGKYKDFKDLVKFVIKPAQAELDAVSPRSFTFEPIQDTHKRGKPITGIRLYANNIARNKSTAQVKVEARHAFIFSSELQRLLKDKIMGFAELDESGKSKAIQSNYVTLAEAEKKLGLDEFYNFIYKIAPNANREPNPIGYTINALKKHSAMVDNQYQPVKRSNDVQNIGDALGSLFNE